MKFLIFSCLFLPLLILSCRSNTEPGQAQSPSESESSSSTTISSSEEPPSFTIPPIAIDPSWTPELKSSSAKINKIREEIEKDYEAFICIKKYLKSQAFLSPSTTSWVLFFLIERIGDLRYKKNFPHRLDGVSLEVTEDHLTSKTKALLTKWVLAQEDILDEFLKKVKKLKDRPEKESKEPIKEILKKVEGLDHLGKVEDYTLATSQTAFYGVKKSREALHKDISDFNKKVEKLARAYQSTHFSNETLKQEWDKYLLRVIKTKTYAVIMKSIFDAKIERIPDEKERNFFLKQSTDLRRIIEAHEKIKKAITLETLRDY